MKKHPTSRFVSLLPAGSCFNDSHQRKRRRFSRKHPRKEDFYGCDEPMPSGFTLSLTKRYFLHVLRLPSCNKFNLKHRELFQEGIFFASHLTPEEVGLLSEFDKTLDILDEVKAAVSKWALFADKAGVSSTSCKLVQSAIQRTLHLF